MKKAGAGVASLILGVAFVLLTGVASSAPKSSGSARTPHVRAAVADPSGYAGSGACKTCHPGQYDNFVSSTHPYKLQSPESAQAKGIKDPPAGWQWSDIWKVIGGNRWKGRFVDNNGYIVTFSGPNHETPGGNQWNLATKSWGDYSPGAKTLLPDGTSYPGKVYDCGACHTTGYSTEGNQEGKPGAKGTWVFDGIQCEACHGPAAAHVADPVSNAVRVDKSSELCGTCHQRGGMNDKVMAKNGYGEHHEQYNELESSQHGSKGAKLTCVSCHDPHKKSPDSTTATPCISCHPEKVTQTLTTHGTNGVTCVSCHLAKATKSAVAPSRWEADVKTHFFGISKDPAYQQFTPDGKFMQAPFSIGFACLSCHTDKDVQWASANATGIHFPSVAIPQPPSPIRGPN